MKKRLLLVVTFSLLGFASAFAQQTSVDESFGPLPAETLLGEKLKYNISFLWFDKVARAEIRLEAGERPGTYRAVLTARTRGMAAFFTRNRVETYTTLMEEGPDGLLRPLLQTSDTAKGKGDHLTHRQTSYAFDFDLRQVTYRKTIDGAERQKSVLAFEEGEEVYDFLTAFYNLRLNRLGPIDAGRNIRLSAFSRKGPEEIVVCRAIASEQQKLKFSEELLLCKVLLSPETFHTKSHDVFVGFDDQLRPLRAVVRDVIGMGDVIGELVQVIEPKFLP